MDTSDIYTTVSLTHLQRLTDSFGMIQHADFAVPDYHSGYTTDDNARALIVAAQHYKLFCDPQSLELAKIYLAFLHYVQREDGLFHNFFGFNREPLNEVSSDDCFSRTLGSLAYMLFAPPEQNMAGPAERMFYKALRQVERLVHPRGKAGSIIALYHWWRARPSQRDEATDHISQLANDLIGRYHDQNRPDWQWMLPEMTYGNAILPEALFRAYQATGEDEYCTVAKNTFEFLCETTFCEGQLRLVGNNGWFGNGDSNPAKYDQQPIDAAAMVEASLAAFDATAEEIYLRRAWIALSWFFGNNTRDLSLYDPETGGCFDALIETGVNMNQGAESTIVLLQAQLSMLEAHRYTGVTLIPEEAAIPAV